MLLQRLLRPNGSGTALERAWSGSYSEQAVELINARLGQICRVDPMLRGEYEDFALPIAINQAIQSREELRHGQYQVSVTNQDGGVVTKTIFVIVPESDFNTVRNYVLGLADGRGNYDAHFAKAFDPRVSEDKQPVGWISVDSPTAFIFTDENMFKTFKGGLQVKPYPADEGAECSRPVPRGRDNDEQLAQ